MARPKYDGVVQAVHYNPDGQVAWVRAYLRRGPTFTDHIQLSRQTLVDNLKSGKRYFSGKRVHQMASTFEIGEPLSVIEINGKPILATGNRELDHDHLDGVPLL
jgi:hypothetical protein